MEDQYVLLTDNEAYFVDYLIGQLLLSHSISEAMIFKEISTAEKFKEMLFTNCKLNCSINTYID